MATLKDMANEYEPKRTKNIAELDKFDINEQVEFIEAQDSDGKPFSYYALVRGEDEYRIPNGVMNDIKNLIAASKKHGKELKTLAVEKSGEGLKTRYNIVTID